MTTQLLETTLLHQRIKELEGEVEKVNAFREDLRHKFNLSQAACAAMRERLEELLQVHEFIDNDEQHQTRATQAVLANDCGQPLLDRLEEARKLLVRCLDTGGLRTDSTRELWDAVNAWMAGGGK